MQSFKFKFLGVTILQGVKFPIFLLIIEWALQQCSATALPVIYLAQLNKTCLLSSTVSEIWRIIGLIFAVSKGCLSLTHSFGRNPKFGIAKFDLKKLGVCIYCMVQFAKHVYIF